MMVRGFGMGWIIWLVVLLAVALVCVLVVVILREATRSRNPAGGPMTPYPTPPSGAGTYPAATGSAATGSPGAGSPGAVPESPLAILARRLASGEIDLEEYQRLRQVLTDGS